MAETFAERRAKLLTVQNLVNELVEINERGGRLEDQLLAQSISTAEIGNTVDKLLDAGGSPTALAEATGDTISDRIINLLNGAITGAVDWSYSASS